MSRPWMPLYVADYLADTMHLTGAEHGAYLLLIMHYWQKGSLPNDDRKLASIARALPEQWSSMRGTIAEFFGPDWTHARIDAELKSAREAYERRASAGRSGGKAKSGAKQCSSNAKAGLKQSQSHTETTPSGVVRDATPGNDLDRLSSRLCEAADGKMNPTSALVVGPVLEMIAQGVDLETDILPAIKATSSRLSRTVDLKYFIGPIRDAYNRRVEAGEGLAKPKVSEIKRLEDMTEAERRDRWAKVLSYNRGTGIWRTWLDGPPPGREGCRVPADMLEQRDLSKDWFEEQAA